METGAGAVAFERDLIERYDVPGPRYTSYPTAVEFRGDFGPRRYEHLVAAGAEPDRPLALYAHLPFCRSLCYFCACHKFVTRTPGVADHYLGYLLREAELQAHMHGRKRPVTQLHLGGGSPTYLDDGQLERLMEGLAGSFSLSHGGEREYSIEIDPRTTGAGTVPLLASLGFNRLSIGVQDFDPAVQRAINRVQSVRQTVDLLVQARETGFRSVSVDLIYGLPLQSVRSFEKTLETVIEARPDRVAAYNYAHLPAMVRAQRLIREQDLPSPAEKLELLSRTVDALTAAGYEFIGMDHFALPEDELARARDSGTLHRNFQGYSTHADCDLVALGVSAIGKLDTCYSQNLKGRKEYYQALDAGELPVYRGVELSAEDVLRRDVIQAILCESLVDTVDIGQRHGIDFHQHFAAALGALTDMARDGLLELDGRYIRISHRGKFLLRSIAMAFDAYLGAAASARFSKVI